MTAEAMGVTEALLSGVHERVPESLCTLTGGRKEGSGAFKGVRVSNDQGKKKGQKSRVAAWET